MLAGVLYSALITESTKAMINPKLREAIQLARRYRKSKYRSISSFCAAKASSEMERKLIPIGLAELNEKGAGVRKLQEYMEANAASSARYRHKQAAYVAELEKKAGVK